MATPRKVLVTIAAVTLVVVLTPDVVRAGGSWIEFANDRVLVGTTVTGVAHFGEGQQAPVTAGPWFATLDPGSGETPIDLGPVAIDESNLYGWKATVTFTVPDVPTGRHWIHVSNAQGEGVGDLGGGVIFIAHTSLEARLWRQTRQARNQLQGSERAIDRAQQAEAQLRADLADRDATIVRQAQRLEDVGARAAFLEADLAARRAEDAVGGPMWPIVLMVAGVAALMAVAFALGRRASGDADAGDGRKTLVDAEPGPARVG